ELGVRLDASTHHFALLGRSFAGYIPIELGPIDLFVRHQAIDRRVMRSKRLLPAKHHHCRRLPTALVGVAETFPQRCDSWPLNRCVLRVDSKSRRLDRAPHIRHRGSLRKPPSPPEPPMSAPRPLVGRDQSENEQLARIRAGDVGAFEALFKSFYAELVGFVES